MKVLVTGAAGKTGRLVLKKLEDDPRYDPKALVRTEESAVKLIKDRESHCPLEHMVVSDITSPTFEDDLPNGLNGMDAMIICTSAVPRISRLSLAGAALKAPWNVIRRKPAVDFKSLRFKWKHGGYPEKVDYHGQIHQIELAKKMGMKKVVVVSSMGASNPDHFLNSVGKNRDGTGNGDILTWKRKAEKYLVESGLNYAIIHPGGLIDTPGGREEFVLDVDDKIGTYHDKTRISREDVAELCVAALDAKQNCSFDCITVPRQQVNGGTGSVKSASDALTEFLQQAKTADYAR
eukprot:CAMPEP_0176068734 /NCGR_PEP_ID=MMETSP0120_2-20121206/34313_1 /TAXON_ID=160619 /ORGANISM="Kryptoperidinium foliaceum, Strain CCMP 1326" /LENGTH=291 /DNA_ID=CAMNT_0017402359 /DNA_START=344 /DNA_END=1219 /DNA_ORIENTATION=+